MSRQAGLKPHQWYVLFIKGRRRTKYNIQYRESLQDFSLVSSKRFFRISTYRPSSHGCQSAHDDHVNVHLLSISENSLSGLVNKESSRIIP